MIIEKFEMAPTSSLEAESLPPYSPNLESSGSSELSGYLTCVFTDTNEDGIELHSVNGVHASTMNENIKGTYTIDAKLPARASPCSRGKGKAMVGETLVDGTFRSKRGDIKIDLHITNTHIRPQPRKVLVRAQTRRGNASVNLTYLHEAAFLNLDMCSGSGDVQLLVPRGFNGIVQIHARKCAIIIDSSLKRHVFILKATDTETLLMVNFLDGESLPSAGPNFCHLETRLGRVLLGAGD